MRRNVFIAVITNLAFIVAGHAMVDAHRQLAAPAFYTAVLAILSGIHHRYLRPGTRDLDYAGMYFALISSGLFIVGVGTLQNILLTLVGGLMLIWKFGSSRVLVGLLAGPLLAAVYWTAGPKAFLDVSALAGIAYVFNILGDHVHNEYHSQIHGLGWHIVIAGCMATGLITIATNIL